MGLTKQYLAYKPCGTFNIICSSRANVNFLIYNKIEGRYIVVGGAEDALVWDLKLGEKILQFNKGKSEVSCLRASPDRMHVAVGYVDGVVEVFDIETQRTVFSLAAHSSAVSIIRYDEIGIRLLSGSLDTELVVSDVVAQVGKQRLIGHNAAVTDGYFFERFGINNIVVSSSKDTQIKFWNLETQTCFKTIVDNRTEVWTLAFVADFLVSGSGESTLNVYRISKQEKNEQSISAATTLIEGLSLDEEETISPINVVNCGVIQRAGKGRTVNLVADKSQRVLITHGTNDLLEIFYVCTEDEIKTNVVKRLKKSQASEKGSTVPCLLDEIKRLPTIKVGNKIKSIDALIGLKNELRVVVTSANNSIQTWSLDISKKNSTPKQLRSITQCGHQSEVRTVSFSSDSLAIVSGSANSMKIWNRESFQCLRTVATNYILSSCFVPGDRHILLGMKSGHLLIVDLGTGEILEEIAAHSNELWSICLLADLQGCATGSSDTTVKIWSFELIEDPKFENNVTKPKILSLLHKKTLKLEEAVLCIKISPNNKFIAAGLLDSTVKIFFLDSFKFFLSLYGHKLPVLCMDISYDSTLIATGSADRNVKIWGLDFGDCHRSLIAHDDSVMGLQFIPKTHMFFSCGKDGKIKQWDGDSFDKIITINGHVGECYSLAVSPNGKYLVSCGSDRTLRLYEQTDEPIVLSDVQEEEREELENQTLATGEDNTIPTLPGLKLPSRKTVGSEKAAESILECLDICKSFEDSDEKPDLHPLMLALNASTPDDFFIGTLERIRASDLEECLILLPFSYVCQILEIIPRLTANRNDKAETILKVVIFLFKIHHKPIVSNQTLLPIINKMITNLQDLVVDLRDMIGINLCSLQLLQGELEEKEGIELFRDISKAKKQREKKMKKRQLTKRLHIQMS